MEDEVFVESEILGYGIASCCCNYAGVRQRWLVIESEKRGDSDLKQLEKRLTKQLKIATSELKSLMKQDFACVADAKQAADKLSRSWKYHSLESIDIETDAHYTKAGRPTKNQCPENFTYRVTAQVIPLDDVIEIARRRAGRFILATPTLRWVFQCFQAVHLVYFNQQLQIANLTDIRVQILRFLGSPCQKYYLIC